MTQLHLDLHAATEYLHTPWSYGVNVRSASALLRKDLQRHLLIGRDECGFRNVRFPGLFEPDMQVVNDDGSYSFARLEQVLDWLMEQGLLPHITLNAPHLSEAVGIDLARALAAFVDGRYGCDVQEWHFELAAPTDTATPAPGGVTDSTVVSSADAPLAAYLARYDQTLRAIKAVNATLRVGGPAASPAVLDLFLQHVATPDAHAPVDAQRCDFVSVACPDSEGPDRWAEKLADVRRRVTAGLGETTPVYVCSWGAEAGGGFAPANDACSAGSRIAARAAGMLRRIEGGMFEAVSDIDQPADRPINYEPFHGGPGLLTVNDVRKASFNAMRLLHEHVGFYIGWEWQEPVPGLMAVVTRDYHNVVRILASYDPEPGIQTTARFTLEGLPESVQWGQVQVLRPSHGSPLESWQQLGEPRFVYRYLLDDLESASHPALAEVNFRDFPPRLEPGMTLQLTIPLPDDVLTND